MAEEHQQGSVGPDGRVRAEDAGGREHELVERGWGVAGGD